MPSLFCTVFFLIAASGGAFVYSSYGSGSSGVAFLPSGAVTAISPTATSPVRDTLFAPFDSESVVEALAVRQVRQGLGLDLHLQTLTAAPYAGDLADRPLPTQRVSAGDAHAMREVIAHYFKDIDESKDVFNQKGELKPSWEMCGEIDFSGDVSGTTGADATLKALGVQECFDGPSFACQSLAGRPCQAICAFMSAFDELIFKFPAGPAFAKHAVVGEAISRKYSSWRQGGVNATWATNKSTGGATFNDLGRPYHFNAVTGWAMCDIARTVLQQNANQVLRGSCAPTAMLSALSGNAPVNALRKATELFWTGRIMTTFKGKPYELKPCDYVYDQVPGMVPREKKYDWPYQAVGLEWYWTATLGQANELLAGNRCDDIKETTYALTGPWGERGYISEAGLVTTSNEVAMTNDGATPAGSLRYCKLIFNDGECNDDEFCCKKNYDLRYVPFAEREKNLNKACSIVMNGGFVSVGVKSGKNDGGRVKFLSFIAETAENAGATGHCEVIALSHTHT